MMRLSRHDRELADRIYAKYSVQPGSMHIAGRNALAWLSACLRKYRPQTVVEFGAGLGTMTELLLASSAHRVVSVETDAFCLDAIAKNIPAGSRLEIRQSAPYFLADLVVIDGETNDAAKVVGPGTLVFVEGIRQGAREKLTASLEERGLTIAFREYGAEYLMLWSRDRLIPIPCGFIQANKGCWIGQARSL